MQHSNKINDTTIQLFRKIKHVTMQPLHKINNNSTFSENKTCNYSMQPCYYKYYLVAVGGTTNTKRGGAESFEGEDTPHDPTR